MKSLTLNNTQHALEQTLSKTSLKQDFRSFHSEVTEIWQVIIARLKGSSEPRVWQTQDQRGRMAWSAYDPTSHQTFRQASAQELRIWLEEQSRNNEFPRY